MNKNFFKKYFILIILLELVLVFHYGNQYFLNRSPKVLENFNGEDFLSRAGSLTDNGYFIDSSSEYTGIFTYGPYVSVKKGSYLVTLYYSTDTDGNLCYAHSNTLPSFGLQSSGSILLPASKSSVSFALDISSDITDLEVLTEYCGEGFLKIEGMELTKTPISYIRNIVQAVLFSLLINLCLVFYLSNPEKRQNTFALTLITLAASYPLFSDYLISGHDLLFHLNRIEGIAQGIQQGCFPVKIHPFWANGYGYAVGVFYGDSLLYFPAILRLMGFSIQNAYKAYVFAINLATVVIAFKCFGKIFSDERIGILGALLYALSPYRLSNLYLRGAVGEYTALTFLPLVLYGFYLIFTESPDKKGYWKSAIPTALGLTGIIQCHIISCELVALIIIIVCLIMVGRICIFKVFFTLCLTVCITLLLNAGFLIPFLSYFGGDFVLNSPEWFQSPIQEQGVYLSQLFALFQNGTGSSFSTDRGMAGEMPLSVGFPFFIGIILFVYLMINGNVSSKKDTRHKLAMLSFGLACLCLILSTHLFPWNWWADLSALLQKMIYNIQFPWRFLTLATLFLVVVCCYAFQIVKRNYTRELYHTLLTCILCFVVVSGSWFYYDILNHADIIRPFDSSDLNSMLIGSEEYLPAYTDLSLLNKTEPTPDEGIEIDSFSKHGTSLQLHLSNSGEDSFVNLPLLYYDGYIAEVKENGSSLELQKGENNVICLKVPAYFEGDVSVRFEEPSLWRIAELISAITLFILIILGICCRKSSTAKALPADAGTDAI